MKKRVMCVHTELVREGSVLYEGKDGNTGITTTEEAAGFAASFFGKQDKELLYVCAVNGELEPVLMELVAKGSKNVCYAEPADIFKSAILANAYGIFCFHNHPGGRAKASKEDINLTARLEACGVMLGIPLLDHIIISSQGEVYSIKEQDEEKLNETISELMINEQIRDREVRLIGADGEQLGIVSSREAQKIADEAGLDLVKIAPNAKPPVCKVIDYGKYRYEQARKEKDAKKKQKTVELKEIRLSPNIEANDLNTKMNAAKKFLAKGNKVKITLRFRGREMAHMNASKHILDDIAENLSDVAVVEKAPKVEGRSIGMVLAEKR